MTQTGARQVSERASFVRADNPGIMTLDGTNTWILRAPGGGRAIVVDPGPADPAHLDAVQEAAGDIALVLYTHHHGDHTDAFDAMRERTGAPARAVSADYCSDAGPVSDGEIVEVDGLAVEVLLTPGHTADSMCLRLLDEPTLLTGDTVLGHGTTVVAHPDGALGPYLDSLARLRELVEEGAVARILPGHGPVVDDARAVLDFYVDHREERLDQVRASLARGNTTPRAVVEDVYAAVDESLWGAAELSVRAQLEYLEAEQA